MTTRSIVLIGALVAVVIAGPARPASSLIGAGEIPTPYLPSTPVAVEDSTAQAMQAA